jgi:hypothetical protein
MNIVALTLLFQLPRESKFVFLSRALPSSTEVDALHLADCQFAFCCCYFRSPHLSNLGERPLDHFLKRAFASSSALTFLSLLEPVFKAFARLFE